MNDKIGLYIHVPFCDGKCPYCDFYSTSYTDSLMDQYVDAVCKSVKMHYDTIHKKANTLYFGGGTPSLLGAKRIIEIVETCRKYFELQGAEITIEVNPTKSQHLDFKALNGYGINRLSIGVQSANNNELKLLGRRHSIDDSKKTILAAKQAGFNNISLDLMLGIQEQSIESLAKSIEFCKNQDIQHVSCYLLKIESGTPYYKNISKLNLPSDDTSADLYIFTCDKLKSYGFQQYEVSNFSIPGMESKHNLKYWNCDEYLGIGPSAHSFIDNKRFFYSSDIGAFISLKPPIPDGSGGDIEEYIMLRLRLSEGIKFNEFEKKFGTSLDNKYIRRASEYQDYGLIVCNKNQIKLTTKGFLLSNQIISQIIL